VELIQEGWNIVVFPEGTRSRDGWVQRFRTGAARLALQHHMPVIPIAIRGSYAAMPRGRGWPRPGRFPVSVRYGPAITPEPEEGIGDFSSRMYDAIARLMEEDRSTWWDSLRRRERGEIPSPGGPDGAAWRRTWESTRPLPDERPPRVWSNR
jgi:1-acyl-sn-glycerol-3-phosphate acyltransferase